jgi:hypothetical protein
VHQEKFIRYYGEDGEQVAKDLLVLEDGSMVLLGSTSYSGKANNLLIKTNQKGEVIWQKVFGDGKENPKDIELTTDGNFLVISNTIRDFQEVSTSGGVLYTDITLYKISPSGDVLLKKVLERPQLIQGDISENGFLKSWFIHSATSLLDGGFILSGNTNDPRASTGSNLKDDVIEQEDIIILRLDNNLNVVWYRPIGDQHYGAAIRSFQVNRNGVPFFYVFGYSNAIRGIKAIANNWFLELTNTGSNRSHILDGDEVEEEFMVSAAKVPVVLGDGFISLSNRRKLNGTTELYVTRLRQELDLRQEVSSANFTIRKTISSPGSLSGVSIAPVTSGSVGYLILGDELKGNQTDIYLTKIDATGKDLPGWPKTFGGRGDDKGAAVVSLPDGKIVLLVTMQLVTQKKIGLIVLDKNGALNDF